MFNKIARTKVRYSILAYVFINVVINYMDRSNISVAGNSLSKELGLTGIELGYLFSAFGWTYVTLQIPGGLLADRFKIRILYSISLLAWSLATIIQGFTSGFFILIGLRALIGAFEAPSYPMNNRIVTSWFPEHERASAIGIYTSGQFIGLAFLTPVLAITEAYFGWRGLFIVTGTVGLVWGVLWFILYRNPNEHSKINSAELNYIVSGGAIIQSENESRRVAKKNSFWKDLAFILSKRKLWGIYIGQFSVGATLIFFLTWFPKYLVDVKEMDFLKSGLLASIPFFAAFVGVILSGFISDYLVRKNFSQGAARKAPIIIGLTLSASILGANFVTDSFWVIFFMSLAFFGNGLASITWIFVSLLAPKRLIGLTGGTFNFIGGLAVIIIPIAIGYLVNEGNFSYALILISSMGIIGSLSYVFLVGKIERIDID